MKVPENKAPISSKKWAIGGSILLLIAISITYVSLHLYYQKLISELHQTILEKNARIEHMQVKTIRMQSFRYIKPIILVDINEQASDLLPLKNKLDAYIQQAKSKGIIHEASVYVRILDCAGWTWANPDIRFSPKSLLKITTLIEILKKAETHPELLKQKLRVLAPAGFHLNPQTFDNKTVQIGQLYSVNDLLISMIQHSDNLAMMQLESLCTDADFNQLMHDLEIPMESNNGEFKLTCEQYAKFFRTLYNASYLNRTYSEYALQLLSESAFKEGIAAGIPEGTGIAHKFGERIQQNERELHETAIVYTSRPYLIAIMSSGNDSRVLAGFLKECSKLTYDFVLEGTNSIHCN